MKEIAGEMDRIKKVVDENPQSCLFARLAEYLLQLNRIPEAIEVCKKGLEHHSNYANAHFVLGQCYFKTQDYDAAESELNKVLLHDPEHIRAYHFQAQIMKERGWNNAYVLSLKNVLAIDSTDQLAQSLLDDYAKEESLETGQDQPSEETIVDKPEEQRETATSTEIIDAEEILTEDVGEQIETTEEEKREEIDTQEEEPVADEEENDKKYEFILDDIFKDEVSQEETTEKIEEDIESYEEIEGILEKSDENVVEEVMEDDEVEQSDREEIAEKISANGDTQEVISQEEVVPPTSKEEISAQEAEPVLSDELDKSESELIGEEGLEESAKKEEPTPTIADQEVGDKKQEQTEDEEIIETMKEESQDTLTEEQIDTPDTKEKDDVPATATTESMEVEEKTEPSKPKEPIVTSTLGEIYAAQGHFAKAISVYEVLLKKDPENEFFKQKIEELNRKLDEEIEKQ